MDNDLYKSLFEEQEKLKERSRIEDAKLRHAYEKVGLTDEGMTVFEDLMSVARVNSTIFTGNSRTFYLLGVQAVGLMLKRRIMEANPEIYFEIERRVWAEEQESRRRED